VEITPVETSESEAAAPSATPQQVEIGSNKKKRKRH
jgi:hypothetical protein